MSVKDAIRTMRNDALSLCLAVLPPVCRAAIERLNIGGGEIGISEIRIRVGDASFIGLPSGSIPLGVSLDGRDVEGCLARLTHGAWHLHADTLLCGYIAAGCGVRVGIVGSARYAGGRLNAIGDVTALVFRLPFFDEKIGRAVRDAVMSDGLHSAVIYSSPCGGKTTALRSLALALCEVGYSRIAVVDERREFYPDVYRGCGVDILSGFERSCGIEIATRVLNPEIILTDELGVAEAQAVRHTALCGVPVVATAHADSKDTLYRKSGICELLSAGVFDYTVGIIRRGADFDIRVDKIC